MAVSFQELEEIEKIFSAEDPVPVAISALRGKFPHLSWTKCDASDVIETPFRSYPRYDIHLLDAADHCVQMTTEPERATGVVIAYRRA